MKSKLYFAIRILAVLARAWGLGYSSASGQVEAPNPAPGVSGFTYQGVLKENGSPVTDSCQMAFRLYGSPGGSDLVGTPYTTTVSVAGGLFSQALDFGEGAFDGTQRWVEVMVKCTGDSSFTALERQEVKATPYALSAPWKGISGRPSNVIYVAKSGGDFNTITEALDSISGANNLNPYLIKVAPGEYNERVKMKPWVGIEGSGEGLTKITYTGSTDILSATVTGANNSQLRYLSVENRGGYDFAIGISNYDCSPVIMHVTVYAQYADENIAIRNNGNAGPTLRDVTAYGTGAGSTTNKGVENSNGAHTTMINVKAQGLGEISSINYGVSNYAASPDIKDVTAVAMGGTGSTNYGMHSLQSFGSYASQTITGLNASAQGGSLSYGVYFDQSYPVIRDSVMSASSANLNYGIRNAASTGIATLKLIDSQVSADDYTILNDPGSTAYIGDTQLDGGAAASGTFHCINVFDENFLPLSATCQELLAISR